MIASERATRWYERMEKPELFGRLGGATLRCFGARDPTIEQPALDENVVSIHLGGPKRVHRWQGAQHRSWDVPVNAVTLMPAAEAFRWRTEGVVAFAHLTLGAELLRRLSREEFDREPGELRLADRVGIADPLLTGAMLALREEVAVPGLRRLYRDSLLTTLGVTLLRRFSTLGPRAVPAGRARGGLAAWQLRRVREFVAGSLERDFGVDDLARLAGLSRAQFFRAFQRSTGSSPARWVGEQRMLHAGRLLREGLRVGEVAGRLHHGSRSHFAAAFRRVHGVSPAEWRRGGRSEDTPP